jgi:hypothetical protein
MYDVVHRMVVCAFQKKKKQHMGVAAEGDTRLYAKKKDVKKNGT